MSILSAKIKNSTGAVPVMMKCTFACTLIFSAGFREYGAALAGLMMALTLFVMLCQNRKCIRCFNIPMAVILWLLPVTCWAVDPYENLKGFIKLSPLLVWIWLCAQLDDDERIGIIGIIPECGAVMTVAGLAALISERTERIMWQADRFGGTFQYSNTCALFMLLGLMILSVNNISVFRDGIRSIHGRKAAALFAEAAILLLGLLLTGSRSVLILTALYGVYVSVRYKKMRLPIAASLAVALTAGFTYSYFTGSWQNVGRIFTTFRYGSTFYGRLLYMKDAFRIIARHPFGLGYMGYYYVQPVFQNGVYETRFVHNDMLQIMLDAGVIPGAAAVFWAARSFVKRRVIGRFALIPPVVFLSSLFDLHMQYPLIIMTVMLCFRTGSEKKIGKPERTEGMLIAAAASVFYAVVLIPFAAYRMGSTAAMLKFFPHDTEAELKFLSETDDASAAKEYAEDITAHNVYAADAYRHLAFISMMERDYASVMDCMDRVIEINRYDLKDYEL